MTGDRRDHDQERRDITAAIGVALALVFVAMCVGMWMWLTYPVG